MPIGLRFGVCVDGENACPPEDCGGTPGYAELLRVLADPDHEEHEQFLKWVGGAFDPEEFDVALANARCRRCVDHALFLGRFVRVVRSR